MSNSNSIELLSPTLTKFCKTCQAETQRRLDGRCKPCRAVSNKKSYLSNPEKSAASRAAWRAANIEKLKVLGAAYYQKNKVKHAQSSKKWANENRQKVNANNAAYKAANPEKERAAGAAWRKANPEKHNQNKANWRAANPERVRETSAAWFKANPEARRIYSQNRRALKNSSGGTLSKDLANKLLKLQKGMRPCCGLVLRGDYHMDHIMPVSLGGANTDDNIQLLHSLCNLKKNAKHPIDFMQSKGFLL